MEELLSISQVLSRSYTEETNVCAPAADAAFIAEAIRRAECCGYLPVIEQRDVNWNEVAAWAAYVRTPGFHWLAEAEHSETGYIILGSNGAIASGQHRILGGLMGDRPVPYESCTVLCVALPTKPWKA